MSSDAPWTAVLWDMDGTIVDASVGIMRRLETTLAHVGLPAPTPEELSNWIGPPLKESFRTQARMTPEEATAAVKFYRGLVRDAPESGEARVYPGIDELIREIHAAGIPQAIASSKLESQVVDLLEAFGLAPFFSVATGASADEITRTSKTDIVIEARRRLRERGVETTRIVLIGDRHHDVEGGAAAEVSVIFVHWGFGQAGEEDGAIATVDDVEQLRALLLPPRDAPPAVSADEPTTEADLTNG